jgi:hypothetical protein
MDDVGLLGAAQITPGDSIEDNILTLNQFSDLASI